MSMTGQGTSPASVGVQRQISLPMRTAVEIAYKNIRMRLSRSLLVTSGIVLALAFLMSIRVNEAIANGMRTWIAAAEGRPGYENPQISRQFAEWRAHADKLARESKELEARLVPLAASALEPPKGVERIRPKTVLGMEMTDIQRELGSLPGSADGLIKAMTRDSKAIDMMKRWIAVGRELKQVKHNISGPRQLASLMEGSGLSPTVGDDAGSSTQTRWLLGLALLVAFVGILNAMLMSVTERFREIGTMKCLGALDGFIVKLFLIESLFQGIIGTLLGIILGVGLAMGGSAMTYGSYAFQDLPMSSILTSILMCFLIGVALTVGGAVYPAWQAARMQPIEAMRVET